MTFPYCNRAPLGNNHATDDDIFHDYELHFLTSMSIQRKIHCG